MSKIEKFVCDKCGREFPQGEWFYSGSLVHRNNNKNETPDGMLLFDGDYCKGCMKENCNRIILIIGG